MIGIAHHVAVRTGSDQRFQAPGLIGPGDTGSRQPDPIGPMTTTDGHRFPQITGLLQIGHHGRNRQVGEWNQGLQLRQAPHQHDESGLIR